MDSIESAVVFSIFILGSIRIVEDKPLLPNYDTQTLTTVPTSEFFNFMKKYGYLDSNPSDSEAQYKDVAVLEAIKNVQRYGALPETGLLDTDTLRLMRASRCGVPDVSHHKMSNRFRRYIIGSFGWQKRTITYFIANWSPSIGEQNVAEEMQKAFEKWAPYGRLKFVRIFQPSADIIVGFGSGYHGDRQPFDGPGNTLAHAYYPYELDAYGGDIHFDNDENWQTPMSKKGKMYSEGVEFLDVATHEIGHSLGLAHSPVYGSIMFPYYKPDEHRLTQLDYDDILAMHRLYIQNRLIEDEEQEVPTEFTTQMPSETSTTIPTLIPNYTFIGDYDTVDNHKMRYADNIYMESKNSQERPDVCRGHFDAVSLIRGEVFIFKGNLVWRLNKNYHIQDGYPIQIHQMFNDLPAAVERFNAVYERPQDSAIVLFSGREYWIYDGYKFIENSPMPITNYGLPYDVEKINAAVIWMRLLCLFGNGFKVSLQPGEKDYIIRMTSPWERYRTGRTYIFVNSSFWRYDEDLNRIDEGYPRDISRWGGIPANIDSAVTLTNGKTYFFKSTVYWLLNNAAVRPEKGYPRRAAKFWLNCPANYYRKTVNIL